MISRSQRHSLSQISLMRKVKVK